MICSVVGQTNSAGTKTRKYMAGETLPTDKPWEKALAKEMVARGAAIEVQGNAGPEETKAKPRAKDIVETMGRLERTLRIKS